MVQIFNLKTIGEKKFSEVFETLKNYTDLLNSDYGIPYLTIKQNDSDVIKIDSKNTYYVWNFIADFNLKDNELITKSLCYTEKLVQTVWITNKKVDFRKNIDLIIQLQSKDIDQFFTDYLSVLEDRFPNNFDLEDLFHVTKNKKLRYDRYTIPNKNSEDRIRTFFNKQLNRKSPLLYHLKTNETLKNSIPMLSKIEDIFNLDVTSNDRVLCILDRNINEISTLTEIYNYEKYKN